MRISDWSSDVCSSDLGQELAAPGPSLGRPAAARERPRGRPRAAGSGQRRHGDAFRRSRSLIPPLPDSRPAGRGTRIPCAIGTTAAGPAVAVPSHENLRYQLKPAPPITLDTPPPKAAPIEKRSEEQTSEIQTLMRNQ